MAFNYPRSGLGNVGEYQTSGLPWVTSSNVTDAVWRVDLPYVSNYVAFRAHSGIVRVGFTENGVNGSNYILLQSGDGFTEFPVRCKTLYLRSNAAVTSSFSMYVGLTQIQQRDFPVLTGSAIYNSGSITFEYGYGQQNTPGSGSGLG